MKTILISTVMTFLSCFTISGQEASPKSSDPKIEKSIIFGKGGDTKLELNLAVPQGQGPFPAVILVHGGGWKGGSYKDVLMNMIMIRLARAGYVGACIQYRLTPSGARFPSQIEDCKCAVRWLRGNAEKYKVDSNRIGALGGSAGGHLVLLLGVTTREDGLEGKGDLKPEFAKQSSAVQAVVNIFGPTDLVNGDWEPEVEPLINELLGGTVKDNKALAMRASPLTYLKKDRAIPPILTFHGTKDNIVPYIHATKLQKALDALNVPSKLVTMEGDGHGWVGEKLELTLKQSMQFLDEHLKARK